MMMSTLYMMPKKSNEFNRSNSHFPLRLMHAQQPIEAFSLSVSRAALRPC
jgi:hypothetical protein